MIINKIRDIKIIEVFLILIVFSFLPMHFILMAYLKNDFSYSNVNFVNIVSITLTTQLLIITIIQIIFKRQYLTIIFGCHNKEERSTKLFINYLNLCSRCTGILIGMLLTVIITIYSFNYYYLMLCVIPLIIDGTLQLYTKYKSNNLKRIITGILFGVGLVVLLSIYYMLKAKICLYIIEFLLYKL